MLLPEIAYSTLITNFKIWRSKSQNWTGALWAKLLKQVAQVRNDYEDRLHHMMEEETETKSGKRKNEAITHRDCISFITLS